MRNGCLLQIWLRGKHLVVRVNGETVVDYRSIPLCARDISLCRCTWKMRIEFKELKIRDLSESDSDETAWQPLFNGENLEGGIRRVMVQNGPSMWNPARKMEPVTW